LEYSGKVPHGAEGAGCAPVVCAVQTLQSAEFTDVTARNRQIFTFKLIQVHSTVSDKTSEEEEENLLVFVS
jgi:hypothetical protein